MRCVSERSSACLKKVWLATLLLCWLPAFAQSAGADPWKALGFLEGTWEAKVAGTSGVQTQGSYVFARELGGHILARHATTDPGCKAPAAFDCAHRDLLYVYEERPGAPLKAIFFDSEGHVIHYDVTTPSAASAVFLSEPSPGPQFRLTYQLKDGIMSGQFAMRPPGADKWQVYLEWHGGRL